MSDTDSEPDADHPDIARTMQTRCFANCIRMGIPPKELVAYLRDTNTSLSDRINFVTLVHELSEHITFRLEDEYTQLHFNKDIQEITREQYKESVTGMEGERKRKRARSSIYM